MPLLRMCFTTAFLLLSITLLHSKQTKNNKNNNIKLQQLKLQPSLHHHNSEKYTLLCNKSEAFLKFRRPAALMLAQRLVCWRITHTYIHIYISFALAIAAYRVLCYLNLVQFFFLVNFFYSPFLFVADARHCSKYNILKEICIKKGFANKLKIKQILLYRRQKL